MAAHEHHGTPSVEKLRGGEWHSVRVLLPYLLEFRGRVALALALLVSAKLANVCYDIRGPVLEKSRNPVTLMHRAAEHVGNVRNHQRMRRFHHEEPDYALLNDVSHSWQALHYYIGREAQEAQLRASGFALLEIFDEQGRTVGAGNDDSASGWLMYVCLRMQ